MNYNILLVFSLISGRLQGADLNQNGWRISHYSLPNLLQNKQHYYSVVFEDHHRTDSFRVRGREQFGQS